ncbi:hypothetical protein T439DRAFT_380271 [Meredithblackwellia eburnea MCA 4105]
MSGYHSGYQSSDNHMYTSTPTYADFNVRSDKYHSQSMQELLNDTTEAPILSGTDWAPGEARREKKDSAPRRRAQMAVGEFVQRRRRSCRGSLGWLKEGNRGKLLLFVSFGLLCALALVLYFVIPRAPGVGWVKLTSDDSSPFTSAAEATFHFNANLSLSVDARATYIPLQISDFDVEVTDVDTGKVIGTGSLSHGTASARDFTTFVVPVYFSGSYVNSSDATYASVASACGPIYPTTTRTSMSLSVYVSMKVAGLIGKRYGDTSVTDITCPVEFSSTSS